MLPTVSMANGFKLEKIVVTAQKRSQSVQDNPMSVSAFDGNALRAMGATDSVSSIAFCPPLIITEAQVDEMLEKFTGALNSTLDFVQAENLLV